jgi:hypothetical protein
VAAFLPATAVLKVAPAVNLGDVDAAVESLTWKPEGCFAKADPASTGLTIPQSLSASDGTLQPIEYATTRWQSLGCSI